MTAERFSVSDLMHGRDYSGQECRGWLAQRKWDGWFAGWDGSRLFTREGKTIPAPAFFTEGLRAHACDIPLCCELLAGKEGANHTQSLVRNPRNSAEWERARLMVFDAPCAEVPKMWGGNNVALRLEAVAPQVLDARHAEMVRTFPLRDRAHLLTELRAVLDAGGEGLMIQRADLPYSAGRTASLLKVKRESIRFFQPI